MIMKQKSLSIKSNPKTTFIDRREFQNPSLLNTTRSKGSFQILCGICFQRLRLHNRKNVKLGKNIYFQNNICFQKQRFIFIYWMYFHDQLTKAFIYKKHCLKPPLSIDENFSVRIYLKCLGRLKIVPNLLRHPFSKYLK